MAQDWGWIAKKANSQQRKPTAQQIADGKKMAKDWGWSAKKDRIPNNASQQHSQITTNANRQHSRAQTAKKWRKIGDGLAKSK